MTDDLPMVASVLLFKMRDGKFCARVESEGGVYRVGASSALGAVLGQVPTALRSLGSKRSGPATPAASPTTSCAKGLDPLDAGNESLPRWSRSANGADSETDTPHEPVGSHRGRP